MYCGNMWHSNTGISRVNNGRRKESSIIKHRDSGGKILFLCFISLSGSGTESCIVLSRLLLDIIESHSVARTALETAQDNIADVCARRFSFVSGDMSTG